LAFDIANDDGRILFSISVRGKKPSDSSDGTLQKCHKRHHLRLSSQFDPTPLRGSQEWQFKNGSWKGPRAPRGEGGGPFGGPGVELWLSIDSSSGLRHNWSIGHSYGQSESNTQRPGRSVGLDELSG
jgi:hypothetical protein